jgi:endonuclease/exonuclease/phosphatase (EEP) superfamily protein YafD
MISSASTSRRRLVSFWGLLEVAVVFGGIATLTGFLARGGWLLELTAHFRLQVAVVLAVLALVAGIGGRRHWALGAGVLGAVNALLVLWVARPNAAGTIPPAAPRLRVLSLNVHTANTRSDLVRELVLRAQPDVVVLLEVNEHWLAELEPLRRQYPHFLADPREDNFGLALFARIAPANGEIVTLGEAGVPSVMADFSVGGRALRLLGTHPLPPGTPAYAWARNGQLQAIAAWCRRQALPVAVLGDLNVTPWSPHFRDLLRDGGLRHERPRWDLGISWPAPQPWFGLPLDHCLTGPAVGVARREILGAVGSDHWPLLVELAWKAE